MGRMFWIFLLQLIGSLAGLSEAEHETLCTSNACFTLHMNEVLFDKAVQNCDHNGGYVMTVRDREEEDVLRLLLSRIQRKSQDRASTFWIGLKLHKKDCVLPDKTLKGFKWVSGEEDSNYSNWVREPVKTCKERCVKIPYTESGQNQLKWVDGTCKSPAFYACKFYFKGMCKPLDLLGPGEITYTAPFSEKPQRSEMESFPLGTYAVFSCSEQQSQYSVCMGTDDTYSWTVPGPFCKTGKEQCEINNGGCEHLCHQEADEVKCLCKEGYDLDDDGFTCRLKDVCGVGTCEHQCVTTESGYFCKCPDGFRLDANQRNCSDVDECQSQTCEDHVCVNTHGSYTCTCQSGYKMVVGTCVDMDECVQGRCEHSCLNSIGSFLCYCNEGFSLSQDDHSCEDIDECDSSLCQFECFNTIGSFRCTCPKGFYLEIDGSTCAQEVTATSASSTEEPNDEETQENFTESLTRTTVELQHQSLHTNAPILDLVNLPPDDQQNNASSVTGLAESVNSRVIVCVLGSVLPLLLLVVVTMAIAIIRCNRSKKEAKKNTTTDGYCWVSSGLDPRLEKLYDSISTDDL
ncbi:complement component C1q receptor-like [Pseudochaenichthys georgianus]|uniref:complement component C1q receptor-like n=1 Tax=Pseudochaenichthys georgianus TaxID=52239 RepID=UPI00146B0C25|nr:complement component C1q receptor-like [Pseudochaenichthys georgianus]XP_033967552.1 complement component C1q receptor-like [Pseudochaenichthys georgianus]